MTRDQLIREASRLAQSGNPQERNLADEIAKWEQELIRYPGDPGIRRMLNGALLDLRDYLTAQEQS